MGARSILSLSKDAGLAKPHPTLAVGRISLPGRCDAGQRGQDTPDQEAGCATALRPRVEGIQTAATRLIAVARVAGAKRAKVCVNRVVGGCGPAVR